MSDSQKPPIERWIHCCDKNHEHNLEIGCAILMIEKSAYTDLMQQALSMREALALALSFAPKGPVPEGLGPMFYHTLNYADEVKLQSRIDAAHKALEQFDEFIKKAGVK